MPAGESPRAQAKDPAHKARNDAPRSTDRGNFLLADRNGKGGFHSHILRIYKKSKRKISDFLLFFTIFLFHKSIFFVLVRIFYNKNIQKRKKQGINHPRKPNER